MRTNSNQKPEGNRPHPVKASVSAGARTAGTAATEKRCIPEWVKRDQTIVERCRLRVCTAEDFLDLFPSLSAVGNRLKILADKGKIKRVGFVDTGGRRG